MAGQMLQREAFPRKSSALSAPAGRGYDTPSRRRIWTRARARWYGARVGRKELLACPVFMVTERENRGPGGRVGRFVVLEAPDWAAVVPVVRREGETFFLMVRQYCHGSDEVSVEFPGGVVEPGEDPAAAAARELAERRATPPPRLGAPARLTNPAFMENRFHVFVAEGLERIGETSLDEHEVIDAFLVSADEVDAPGWARASTPTR